MKAKKYRRPKFSHGDTNADKLSCLSFLIFDICFVHPIFSSFGFSYFGHFSYFLSVFFHLALLALQNVNKDYIIFSYFRNFVAKSDQKPKTKNGMNEIKENKIIIHCYSWLITQYRYRISANSFLPLIVSVATIQFMK